MKIDPPLAFDTIHEAEFVLKAYPTAKKLRRLVHLGVNIEDIGQKHLADFIGATTKRVSLALRSMGMGRYKAKTEYMATLEKEVVGG